MNIINKIKLKKTLEIYQKIYKLIILKNEIC